MYKRSIRIIKRNKVAALKEIRVVSSAKAAIGVQHERADSINSWISERRENARLERVFSDTKILAWKMLSPKLKERPN
jgi:hypothetical protein